MARRRRNQHRKRRPPDENIQALTHSVASGDGEPPPPPKRSRPDVAARIAANKARDFFARKLTLKQFSRKEAQELEWDTCLKDVNQAIAEAYLLANFYVLRQLEGGRRLCKIDQTFYQTCLSLVTSKSQAHQHDREQCDDEVQQQEQKRDCDLENAGYEFMKIRGCRPMANTKYLNQGWFQSAARQMATNARNSIIRNFAKRLRSFVMDVFELTGYEAHVVLNGVFSETFDGVRSDTIDTTRIDPIVIGLRDQIPRTPKNKISWDARDLLPIIYLFLIQIERSNKENEDNEGYLEKRTFSLLPTKQGFEASYCKVDSMGLRGLLLRSPRVDRALTVEFNGVPWTLGESIHHSNMRNWNQLADLWWRRLFFVDNIEKEGRRTFHREISTDGFAVSVMMHRPKLRTEKSPDDNPDPNVSNILGPPLFKMPKGQLTDYDVVWGVDPGRTDFITATNQAGETVRFRSSAYRSSSGFNRSNYRSNREIDKVPWIRQLLRATPTKKTASLTKLSKHIEFAMEHLDELLTFFLRPVFRRLKFRRLALKNSQLDRACNELVGKPGTRTIIGFGDSGTAGNSVIKNCPAGPVKMLARKLARCCEVVVVDEFRTSRVHYDCDMTADLTNQMVERKCKDGVVRKVKVHKVLHCLKRKGGCGISVDRDVNAAKNILSVLMCQLSGNSERPERLRRHSRPTN